MIALAHQFRACDIAVRSGSGNRNHVESYNLSGKTLGLIGYGRIAKGSPNCYHGVEYESLVCRSSKRTDDLMENVELVDTIDEIFEKSDFVSLHTPATQDTEGLINLDLMKKMKNPRILSTQAEGRS